VAAIDLNVDLGEGDAHDAELLEIVSSCSIACGGHAGDAGSMAATVAAAIRNGVVVGAHPGYPDRDGFGRESGFLDGDALYESLTGQVTALADIAAELGARLAHVKPHGALYNDAVANDQLADIIARVTAEAPGTVSLVGMAGTGLQRAAGRHRLNFVAEGFIDRAYEPDGTLMSRKKPGAVHTDFSVAVAQAVSLARDGYVSAVNGDVIRVVADTLCIHGDTPGAADAARQVRDALEAHGIEIRAYSRR